MDTFARDFPSPPAPFRAAPHLRDLVAALSLARPEDLGDPALGTLVTSHRTSWVRRVKIGSIDCHIKTYVYTSAWERGRGTLRNTGPFCASRAAREAAALHWLAAHGFTVAPVLAVIEERRVGWVAKAILVTQTWPGEALDRLIPHLEPRRREQLAVALGQFVARLHDAGFRDGNLDLRNLLGAEVDDGFVLTKIDSPRFAIVRPGRRDDRRCRADWSRLLPQLQPWGIAELVRTTAATTPPPT